MVFHPLHASGLVRKHIRICLQYLLYLPKKVVMWKLAGQSPLAIGAPEIVLGLSRPNPLQHSRAGVLLFFLPLLKEIDMI